MTGTLIKGAVVTIEIENLGILDPEGGRDEIYRNCIDMRR